MFTIFAQPCVGLSFGGLAWFLGVLAWFLGRVAWFLGVVGCLLGVVAWFWGFWPVFFGGGGPGFFGGELGKPRTSTDTHGQTHSHAPSHTHTHTHIHSHRHEHTHAHTHAHRHTHAHADTASRVGPLRCGTADRRNSAAIQSSGRSARHLLANYVPQVRHKRATRVCRMCATFAPNVCHM